MRGLCFVISLFVIGAVSAPAQRMRGGVVTETQFLRLRRAIEPLYRKPTKKELKAVEASRALAEKYAVFLRQPDTGLTKLIDDKGCAASTKVVNASEKCLQYTMPGAGSSFSFRTQNYRIPRLADVTFTDRSFQASGALLHGIFVNLGNVPLEAVSLETNGMEYLVDFQPETDFDENRAIDLKLTNGVRRDGFLYRRGLYAVENTTFALRSVAYGGRLMRASIGVTYNEFNFDKRKDVIVVFRIVEKDAEGNVTILWKQLQEKDSPKIVKRKMERVNKTE